MSSKLSRDEILRDILVTLVSGWGEKAVSVALSEIVRPSVPVPGGRLVKRKVGKDKRAVEIATELDLPAETRSLVLTFARAFDDGRALPTMSDVRTFLISHHAAARDLKSRGQAFTRIAPILQRMSEKGLMAALSRSYHSGPAELESISVAIRGAGETLRGQDLQTSGRLEDDD